MQRPQIGGVSLSQQWQGWPANPAASSLLIALALYQSQDILWALLVALGMVPSTYRELQLLNQQAGA